MPALPSYIGQYGESLKRLSALGNPNIAPQPMGGADLGSLPAPAMPGQYDRDAQGAQMSLDQSGVPAGPAGAGALPGGTPAPTAAPAAAGGAPPPISFGDMQSSASTADKEAALKNLEKHVNIGDEFDALQEHGIIPKEAKMSRHEKGMLVMEFGLRMMSATAQGMDAAGAAGVAGQGLLESYRARKVAEGAEATRQGERAQDRDDKLAQQESERTQKNIEGNQRQTIAYQEQTGATNRNNADNKTRMDVAQLEAKTRMNEARMRAQTEKQPQHFVDSNGDLKLVDSNGKVTTPTEETVDAKTGKKGRKTIKPMQKADSSGIDQDKVQSLIEAEKKRLAEDPATSREMRKNKMSATQQDQYLEKQARKNVTGRLGPAAGGSDPLGLGVE